jgi:hypothetical protein
MLQKRLRLPVILPWMYNDSIFIFHRIEHEDAEKHVHFKAFFHSVMGKRYSINVPFVSFSSMC